MTKIRFLKFWVTFTAFVLAIACASKPSTYRPDDFLIENFQVHKGEFNTLLELFRADKGLIYYSRGYTIPENTQSVGLSPARLEQYRQLFLKLGLDGMAAADRVTGDKDEVWFFTSIEGSRPSTFKHYAYVNKPPNGIIQDLDKQGSKSNPYRHVEDNWYLALDDADSPDRTNSAHYPSPARASRT